MAELEEVEQRVDVIDLRISMDQLKWNRAVSKLQDDAKIIKADVADIKTTQAEHGQALREHGELLRAILALLQGHGGGSD